MRIVVSGSSGLVGSALLPALRAAGHRVARLVRSGATRGRRAAPGPTATSGPDDIPWDPLGERIDAARLEGADALINLPGAGIAAWLCSAASKDEVRRCRANGTQHLTATLTRLERPARILVRTPALDYYPDRSAVILIQ